jgi:plastocyanin
MLATSSIGLAARAPVSLPHRAALRAATGRIEGTVVISAALTARRPQFRIYSDPGAGGAPPPAPRDPLNAEVRNVVLYLEGDSTALAGTPEQIAAHRRGAISQRDERFAPHVRAVMRGGSIDFPNEDDVFHNVYSLSSAAGSNGFDLGRYPKGASRAATFNKPGTINVFCHIHSEMSAIVLVLENPFFALPDENRRYVIDDVPEGEYTIVGWHERIKPITRRVRVIAGQTSPVDFNIPLPQGGGRL